MYYHAPGTSLKAANALANVKPSSIGLGLGLTTALLSVPVGALAFGLIGLIFKKGGKGALLGASLGAVYSTWMGFSAGRMASIVKSSPQFKSAQKQLALDSIDLSKSGLDSESGIQFHGMARSIAPL